MNGGRKGERGTYAGEITSGSAEFARVPRPFLSFHSVRSDRHRHLVRRRASAAARYIDKVPYNAPRCLIYIEAETEYEVVEVYVFEDFKDIPVEKFCGAYPDIGTGNIFKGLQGFTYNSFL